MSDVTPGPWMLGVSTNVEFGPWPCFRLRDMNDPTDTREIEADRRLMEAAPELLLALDETARAAHWKECETAVPLTKCDTLRCQRASAAIAHATEPKR